MNQAILEKLTNGRLLARNTLLNFAGQSLPLVAAIFTIPLIIKGLGTERFGILTLIWAVIGYAGLFDLGFGRALTQLISKKIGADDTKDLPILVWTALLIVLGLGVIGAVVVAILTQWIVLHLFKVPSSYVSETINSMYLLALSLPLVIANSSFRGILEAYQKFSLANAVRTPLGIWNFASPLLILVFSKSLTYVVAILIVGTMIAFIANLILCMKVVQDFSKNFGFCKNYIKPLINFGGWLTVSNIISPIMVYFDRIFIASTLSMTAVAYYTTPYTVITKLLIIPSAVLGVMFPAFSAVFSKNKEKTRYLYYQSLKYVIFLLLPFVIIIILFAKTGLTLWLNPEFANNSFRAAQILAVGVLINSLAFFPFGLIQASGRADITAKFHLLEIPVYLILLWIFVKAFGLTGAALAWSSRVSIDCLMLHFYAAKLIRE
ncbi:MAG: flippase [bacterium]